MTSGSQIYIFLHEEYSHFSLFGVNSWLASIFFYKEKLSSKLHIVPLEHGFEQEKNFHRFLIISFRCPLFLKLGHLAMTTTP